MFSGGGQTSLSSLSDIWSSTRMSRIIRDFAGVMSLSSTRAGFTGVHTAPYRKSGFTLAEVLITLGIIGVVAAMTMPSLINRTQGKELEAGFKRAYSILTQAIVRMGYEEGVTVNYDNFPANKFAPAFKKYITLYMDCGSKGCVFGDIDEEDVDDYFKKVSKYRTYNKSQNVTLEWFDEGQAILADGMFVMIQNSGSKENGIVISVDVNGLNKGPNIWGHDLFSFQVTDNGKLLPMGDPNTRTGWGISPCDAKSSARHNGLGCAYRAFTEKDYFKNLP